MSDDIIQIAQATPAVGQISAVSGDATIVRVDGTIVLAEVGTPVFQNDTIETGDGGSIDVVFQDDSRIGLKGEGTAVIDEFVYQPEQSTGEMSVNFVKGLFSFASGDIAKTGDDNMSLSTPVATIGIRGTTGVGFAGPEGTENFFVLLPDTDGTIGEISIRNQAGFEVLSTPLETVSTSSAFAPPSSPEILTVEQLAERYPVLIQLLSDYLDSLSPDGEEGPADGQEGTDESQEGFLNNDGEEIDTAEDEEESDVILAAGEDGDFDSEELDLGNAPTFGELGEGENAAEPSPFVESFSSASDVSLFSTGETSFTSGESYYTTGTAGDTGDSDVLQGGGESELFSPNTFTSASVGGLAGVDFALSSSFFKQGVGPVSVYTPSSLVGGLQGSDAAFEQVSVDLSTNAASQTGSQVSITQDTDGNVLLSGDGMNLALNSIEEVNLTLGDGADSISLGALGGTDIAQNTVIINGGDGDDTISVDADVEVGKNLDIFGGAGNDSITGSDGLDEIFGEADNDTLLGGGGNDVIDGGSGDDAIFGDGAELLTATGVHSWGIARNYPVFSEKDTFEKSQATPGSDVNLTFNTTQDFSVRFVTEGAGYKNSIGYYKISEDGTLSDVEFLFENASQLGSGGNLTSGDSVSLNLEEGDTIGFFLVSNGNSLNNFNNFSADGHFEFRNADGSVADATVSDASGTSLFFVPSDESLDAVELNGDVIHGTLPGLNANGEDGIYAGVNPSNSALLLGFDDQLFGDADYNDVVLELFAEPVLDSSNNDDTLFGGEGNDRIYGEEGADILRGEAGVDFLFGGFGDDILVGGEGFDVMYGGVGSDVFLYEGIFDAPAADGVRDVIMDFESALDTIVLDGLLTGSFSVSIDAKPSDSSAYNVSIDTDGDDETDLLVEVNVVDGGALTESHILGSVAGA